MSTEPTPAWIWTAPEDGTPGGHGDKKDRKKEQAIAALLDQPSIAKAAKAIHIAENTLNAWLKDPAFAKDYRTARDEALKHAMDRLGASTAKAVETILTVMEDPETPPASRLSAARTIIDTHLKVVEARLIEDRVTDLETYMKEKVKWD